MNIVVASYTVHVDASRGRDRCAVNIARARDVIPVEGAFDPWGTLRTCGATHPDPRASEPLCGPLEALDDPAGVIAGRIIADLLCEDLAAEERIRAVVAKTAIAPELSGRFVVRGLDVLDVVLREIMGLYFLTGSEEFLAIGEGTDRRVGAFYGTSLGVVRWLRETGPSGVVPTGRILDGGSEENLGAALGAWAMSTLRRRTSAAPVGMVYANALYGRCISPGQSDSALVEAINEAARLGAEPGELAHVYAGVCRTLGERRADALFSASDAGDGIVPARGGATR